MVTHSPPNRRKKDNFLKAAPSTSTVLSGTVNGATWPNLCHQTEPLSPCVQSSRRVTQSQQTQKSSNPPNPQTTHLLSHLKSDIPSSSGWGYGLHAADMGRRTEVQGDERTGREKDRLTQAKLHHPGGLANSSYFVYKDRFSAELWRGYPRGIGTIVNDIVGTRCGVRRVLDLSV